MRHSRKLRLSAILALGATAALMLAAAASAGQIFRETFHEEETEVINNYCGVPGLTVESAVVVDGRANVVPHGRDGLPYGVLHIKQTGVVTNLANGNSVTFFSTFIEKDLRVTDNGDGTLTILVLVTGNDVIYGPDGKAIGRNPGQIRVEILVDHGGTPTDPSDDVQLDFRLVRESTGRNDDFCEAAVPILT